MRNETRSLTRLLSLLGLASSFGFAATWSGNLVDANCFQSMEDNHNVSDSPALRDVGLEVRVCSPKPKTHVFAIVLSDGTNVRLDATGNARAADLARRASRKAPLYVTVNGAMTKKAIAVNSVTLAQ